MLTNPRHELFARLVAAGKPATRAYIEAGFAENGAEQSASRLLKKVECRVRELQAEIGAKLEKASIRDLNERIREYQSRWGKMRTVIEERAAAEEMQVAAGGKTGLLVRTLKSIGSGENATTVEEFAVDTGLLRELRELELQVSKELGQYEERHKHEHSGPDGGPIQITDERLKELTDEELSGLASTLRKLADVDGSGRGDSVPPAK